MNKKNIIIAFTYIIAIILLITFLLYDYRQKNLPMRCSGELSILLANRKYNLKMNGTISIIGTGNKKGIIRIKGSIKDEGNTQSVLNRVIYFTRIDKNKDVFTMKFNDMEKLPTDTTDNDIFELFSINHSNLRMVSQIDNNTILFHDTMAPQFLCVKY